MGVELCKYDLEYKGVICTEVNWESKIFYFRTNGEDYCFTQIEDNISCIADTDYIRCVIESQFLPWLEKHKMEIEISRLERENEYLRKELKNSVKLPVPLGKNFAIVDYGFRRFKIEEVNIVGYNFSPYDKNYITPVDEYGKWHEPDWVSPDLTQIEKKLDEIKEKWSK